jgi:hypothetical protein|tara:strand:- start:184 stop:411 length:228 start_codon:yes stop_codon:yes gene_type:complete
LSNTRKPPIPPLTCPNIDRVIELVETLVHYYHDESFSTELVKCNEAIILQELELIRQSNNELRRASKYWYDKRKR